MKFRSSNFDYLVATCAAVYALMWSFPAGAHCDTLDGPVVAAARKALESGNVNLVLVWVHARDDAEIRKHFDKTLAVRKLGPQARELADHYFFETLVRIHRAGEGAPYTGLKPAGSVEPIIAAADRALTTGKPDEVAKLISSRMEQGLHRSFEAAMSTKGYAPKDLAAGRSFVSSYIEYTHYVERLYNAAETLAPAHVKKQGPGLTHGH